MKIIKNNSTIKLNIQCLCKYGNNFIMVTIFLTANLSFFEIPSKVKVPPKNTWQNFLTQKNCEFQTQKNPSPIPVALNLEYTPPPPPPFKPRAPPPPPPPWGTKSLFTPGGKVFEVIISDFLNATFQKVKQPS